MLSELDFFIKRTLDKYPNIAKQGLCWVSNVERDKPHFDSNWEAQKRIRAWAGKGVSIVGFGFRKDVPAYDFSGKNIEKNAYPLFIDCGDQEILDKLGYSKSFDLKWAETGMTKEEGEVNRFTMMDLDDDDD